MLGLVGGSSVLESVQRPFDVAGQGDIAGALVIIPSHCEANIIGAVPIGGHGVLLAETG
jgi:hypothetical protein